MRTRSARYAYLSTFRSTSFQRAALRAGYTDEELFVLRSRLLEWSKSGNLRLELNPALGGFATPDRATVGLRLILMSKMGIQTPMRSAAAHELAHMLQEIRYGALTSERAGALTRADVLRYELGAEMIGHWAVGRELGWVGRFRAHLASWLH